MRSSLGSFLQQQTPQRPQVVECSTAGGQLSAQLLQLVGDQAQGVELPAGGGPMDVFRRVPDRLINSLTEQLHEFLSTFNRVEGGVWCGHVNLAENTAAIPAPAHFRDAVCSRTDDLLGFPHDIRVRRGIEQHRPFA